MDSDYLIVFSTCPDRATAEEIAETLVAGGQAACVNVIGGLTSIYRWEGAIQRDQECLLIAKTGSAAYAGLQQAICERHPDDVPEIVAAPLVAGLENYLHWVGAQTTRG